jgi:hypothetical protein
MLYNRATVTLASCIASCNTEMKREKTRQANWRLPETLLDELREVSEKTETPLTDIVRSGLQERVNRLKAKIAREERSSEAVPA